MKSRNGNQQDRNLERELAAVDAALAGQPVAVDLADLGELALAIQAERPRPRPGFNASLDAQLRQGFRAQALKAEPAEPRRRRRLLPFAVGTAASVFIVGVAIVSSGVLSGNGGRVDYGEFITQTEGGGGAGPSADRARGTAAPSASSPSLQAAPSRGARVLPHVRDRKVERDAALTLAGPLDEIESIADGVIQVTDRYQGFVLRSSVSSGDRGEAGATLELRIPSDRLQPALRDLSKLAHVRSRTQTTQDITARFVSARSRLGDALVERRALLRQLARATTPNETASIRARLRLANREIAAARSSLRGLRNRVDFSTVSVAIEPDDSLKAEDGGWSPGDALHDALGILGTALAVLLVTLAVLLPLSALALLGWIVSSRIRRRRREQALNSAEIEKSAAR